MRNSAYVAIAGSLLACAVFSQDAPDFRSHLELVVIPCAVVDATGSPVRGLAREDFRIFDNDVPRIVSYFSQDDDQPMTLGILIDDSDSQHDLLSEHRRTVFELLHRMLRPNDSAFVISVGEDVRLYRDLTLTEMESFGEPCLRRGGISACGGSPLWNAVYDAARLKLRGARGNKALLLLTDGFDTGSVRTWSEAAAAAQKADTVVYAIQYRSGSGRGYAPELYRLVGETSGTWFSAPSGDLGAIVARLETDLRRRYVVGFRPERVTFGKLRHKLRVEVTRPDVSVRARKSYFEDFQHER
ncbi:VWA domain-containing protein [uncultured Paludibaculum sp.]|uniref:VWA domain-containing protein n=1 Tax=uncultured Paludibaculum sp. TaxID=1765020 RepID=UPI002AAB388B|nr:VWA domain-containing protein [uncultured Paludibaculum sp.]